MKKIISLFILQFSMLMAAGITITADKTLDRGAAQAHEPDMAKNPSSGIIPNSIDKIWEDNHGKNTGYVSNMKAGWPQFKGPFEPNMSGRTFNLRNVWIEVEAAGNGTACSLDISKSTNTRVEVSRIVGYALNANNQWIKKGDTLNMYANNTGVIMPHPGEHLFPGRECGLDEGMGGRDHPNPEYQHYNALAVDGNMRRIEPAGNASYKPQYLHRFHGWASLWKASMSEKHVFGEVFVRLILDDPNGVDDRDKANYVVHVGSDLKNNGTYVSGSGLTRYVKVTKDWQPISLLTGGMTRAELEANPPPFRLAP